jgi:hypothetical protein
MQAELEGWHAVAGHEHCNSIQGQLRLTSKIGSEEKAGDRLSPVCPVSVAMRSATTLWWPGDSDIPDIPTIGCYDMHRA